MKISDLIEKLKEFDRDLTVIYRDFNDEYSELEIKDAGLCVFSGHVDGNGKFKFDKNGEEYLILGF